MSEDTATERAGPPARPDYAAISAVALVAYLVMAGDFSLRDTHPLAIVFDACLAAGLVLLFVMRVAARADRFDALIVLSLVLFIIPAVFSQFPRQSFDSALGALAYVAGLFLAREILARESGRRVFTFGLMALSAVLTTITAVAWLGIYLRWWSLTDWTVFPPLGMNLPSSPWGHRHDLALLLAMLYPAWWIGRTTPLRAVVAVAIGLVVLALVIIGGSRMVWLALAGATVVIAAPLLKRWVRWSRVRSVLLGLLVALALTAVIVTGVAEPVGERLLGGVSLAERTAMWGPLVQAWSDRSIVGYGPGSFPWILQLTGYFDTHSFAPRHPDSAVMQLLAEAGLFGLLALGILLAAVGWRLWSSRSMAATWAIVAFALASLAGNPTDFVFMVAVATGWLAYAAPHEPRKGGRPLPMFGRAMRALTLAAVVVVGIAFAATTVSRIAFSTARTALLTGGTLEAHGALRLASTLDPAMALYPRQLGALELLSGDADAAMQLFRRAAALNPTDDLAWRGLAIAYRESGDGERSSEAISNALELQLSDPTNLLLAASDRVAAGDQESASELLVLVVQAWPEIVAAPGWPSLAADGPPMDELVTRARDRWTEGASSPEPLVTQWLLLDVMTGASGNSPPVSSRLNASLAGEYQLVMRCDPEALGRLADASQQDKRQATYWALAVRAANAAGADAEPSALLFTIMTGDVVLTDGWDDLLNPLDENGARGSSADRWGYRRQPIEWPATPWDLPSPRSGFQRWFLSPSDAAQAGGLSAALPECR